jgi:hypothetical protein
LDGGRDAAEYDGELVVEIMSSRRHDAPAIGYLDIPHPFT